MENVDEGDILPNPEEAVEYENTMVYNKGEEIIAFTILIISGPRIIEN